MSRKRIKLYFFCALALFVFKFTMLSAQAADDLTVKGGLMYTSWVESESSILCGVTIETPSKPTGNRNPVQIIFLIDASHYMVGNLLQNAKTSAKKILNSLLDKDMFGVITYSSHARTIVPLQPLNSNNRKNAEKAINRLKYENDRDLLRGLKMVDDEFNRVKGQRSEGHYLLLFTNGNPNKGVTDPGELLSNIQGLAKKHDLQVSTFGYDRFFDEDFMITCAKKTNGRAFFIEEEEISTLPRIINEEIKRIISISAKNAIVEISLPPNCSLKNVNGGLLQDNKISIGDIQENVKKPLIFEINKRPSRSKEMIVNVEYIEPIRLTNRKTREYIDIPLNTGTPEYDKNYAPWLLEFSIQSEFTKAIEKIKKGKKTYRKNYGDQFKETVKKWKKVDNILRAPYFTEALNRFEELQLDIENAAIFDELLIKRAKYKLLDLVNGK